MKRFKVTVEGDLTFIGIKAKDGYQAIEKAFAMTADLIGDTACNTWIGRAQEIEND